MFSSRTPRLFAAALMDLAEAVLRPVDVDEASPLRHADEHAANVASHRSVTFEDVTAQRTEPNRSWLLEDEPFADLQAHRPHEQRPHSRRRLREQRSRRPGAIAPATAVCSTPLAEPRRAAPPFRASPLSP